MFKLYTALESICVVLRSIKRTECEIFRLHYAKTCWLSILKNNKNCFKKTV